MRTYYVSCSQFPYLAIRFGRMPFVSCLYSFIKATYTNSSMLRVKIRPTMLAEWYVLCPFCKRPDLERISRLATYLRYGGPEPPERPCSLCRSGDVLI